MREGLFEDTRRKVKLTKNRKFILSWTVITIVLLMVCYPLGHLSVIAMAIYAIFRLFPNIKNMFKKWLHWMSYDD